MVWIGAVMSAGPELAFVASPGRLFAAAGRGAHHRIKSDLSASALVEVPFLTNRAAWWRSSASAYRQAAGGEWSPAKMFRQRRFGPRAREALELLASEPHGVTEAFIHAQGFSLRTLVGLVRAGLATVRNESPNADSKSVAVTRITITDAGRKVLE
jgi:hypothetical protein